MGAWDNAGAEAALRKTLRKTESPVFVDRSGYRRRAVIGFGLVIAVLLLAWLVIVGAGVAVLVAAPPPAAPAGPAPAEAVPAESRAGA